MENTREMPFTPHDDLIQTGAAHTSEQSLDAGVLPGACGAIRTASMPMAWTHCYKAAP